MAALSAATGVAPAALLDPDLPDGFLELMAEELARMTKGD